MTVSVPGQLTYSTDGDGVTTSFSYPVRFLAKAEIKVYLRENGVNTLQVLNTHYTIAGSSWPSGGNIVFLTPPTALQKVVRYRDTAATQTVDLANTQRNDAPAAEVQFDRHAMVEQDIKEQVGRSWKADFGETAGTIAVGPAGSMPVFDEDGGLTGNVVPDAAGFLILLQGLITGITAFWLAVLQTSTFATAWLQLKMNGSLESRNLLKAVVPAAGMSVLVAEPNRVAQFLWTAGEFSAAVAADTEGGIYVKANTVSASVGAWVAQPDQYGFYYAGLFGLVDDPAFAINQYTRLLSLKASTEGMRVSFRDLRLRYDTSFTVSGNVHWSGSAGNLLKGVGAYITFKPATAPTDISAKINGAAASGKGGTVLNLVSTADLSVGDWLVTQKTGAERWHLSTLEGHDYPDGEMIEVSAILDATSIRTKAALKCSYTGSLTLEKLYKFPAMEPTLSGMNFAGNAGYAARIERGKALALRNLSFTGGTTAAVEIDRCFGGTIDSVTAFNDSTVGAPGDSYGLDVINSQDLLGTGGKFTGGRCGLAIGSSPNAVGAVTNRNVIFRNGECNAKLPAVNQALDFHGHAEDCGYLNMRANGGVFIGGRNNSIAGTSLVAASNEVIKLTEFKGGIIDLRDVKITLAPGFSYPAGKHIGFASSSYANEVTEPYFFLMDGIDAELSADLSYLFSFLSTTARAWGFSAKGVTVRGTNTAMISVFRVSRVGAGVVPTYVDVTRINDDLATVKVTPLTVILSSNSLAASMVMLPEWAGSGANGSWKIDRTGVQECWHEINHGSVAMATAGAKGGFTAAAAFSWSYERPFLTGTKPVVHPVPQEGTFVAAMQNAAATNTAATYLPWNPATEAAASRKSAVRAIGRAWTALV